jgi:hypothetical protein
MKCYEYKVIDTGKHVEKQLNELGAQGWQVVGITTKKQLLIAPPQAIILMRELQPTGDASATASLVQLLGDGGRAGQVRLDHLDEPGLVRDDAVPVEEPLPNFAVAGNNASPFAGLLCKPSDGLEPSTPSLPCAPIGNWSQPVATVLA